MFQGGKTIPDLFTHLLLGLSLALILRIRSREEGCLILLGSMMLDIERPFSLIVENLGLNFIQLTTPFHSLLGTFFLTLLISNLFDLSEINLYKQNKIIFLCGIIHLLADMTLHPWEEKGIFLLYPLKIPFSFNLFWPGFIGYPFFGFIILLISFIWFYFQGVRENLKNIIIDP